MKLSKWAKEKGISYLTAYRWAKSGKIKGVEIMQSGTILVNDTKDIPNLTNVVIYTRVSSNHKKKELDYKVNRIIEFANKRGLAINKVYKEVDSSKNKDIKQFCKMLDNNPSLIIIENKDVLSKIGFNYIKKLTEKLNIEILVMYNDEN